jgi:hypothetical protein
MSALCKIINALGKYMYFIEYILTVYLIYLKTIKPHIVAHI